MTNQDQNPHVSIETISRLGVEATDVIERNGSKPSIAAHAPRVVPNAQAMSRVYDELKQLKVDARAALAGRDVKLAALLRTIASWSGHADQDIEGFGTSELLVSERTVLAVVDNGRTLIGTFRAKGETLPYAQEAISDLQARCDDVLAAHQTSKEVRVALQEKQREGRTAALALHDSLVALRRTLRAVLGSDHYDYQRLRMTRSRGNADPPVGEPAVSEPTATPSDGVTA